MKTSVVIAGCLSLILVVAMVVVTLTGNHPAPGMKSDDRGAPQGETTDLSAQTMKFLAAALKQRGVSVEAKGSSIEVGGRRLSVSTTTESVTERDGETIVGLAFAFSVGGKPAPALQTGSIGIDKTREAAVETAIQEWVFQYGLTTATAVLSSELTDGGVRSQSPLSVGDLVAFAGATGIRGEAPEAFRGSDSFHKAFITHANSLLAPLVADRGLHALTLTVVFKEGAPLQGECRLDGQVSAELLTSVRQYVWPKVTGTFMLKQHYVFFSKSPR
jgi:hypothetical protein